MTLLASSLATARALDLASRRQQMTPPPRASAADDSALLMLLLLLLLLSRVATAVKRQPSRADTQAEPANGGGQPPPTHRGVPVPSERGVSGSPYRGVSAPFRRGISRPSRRRISGPSIPRVPPLFARQDFADAESSDLSLSEVDDFESLSSLHDEDKRCPHPQCDKRFKSIKDAVKHVNYTHRDAFPLPRQFKRCSVCHKVYTADGVAIHLRRTHGLAAHPNLSLDENDRSQQLPPLEPPLAPAPDASLEDLHQFYRSELTWVHAKWKPHLQTLHQQLTSGIISREAEVADISLSAYLILPGFLESVRIAAKLPGAKQMKIEPPITYLRLFTSEESRVHPETVIITTAKQLLFKIRRSLSIQRPNSVSLHSRKYRKIDALTQLGRISKAARLADSLEQERDRLDHNENLDGRITREQAVSVLPRLFPEATSLDDLGDNNLQEWGWEHPLQLSALDVDSTILKLNIDRAAGYSGWSNRLLKNLYLQENQNNRQQLADNYAKFFNKLLKGELSAHMRKYFAPVRLCLIPKTKNPSDLKFRPIGVGETLFRLLGRAILSKVGKEIGNQIAPLQLAVGISGGVEIAASIAGMLQSINQTQPPEEPEFATMSIDVSNAFNNIRRSHILDGLRRYCPSLIPYFFLIYGDNVDLRWNDGSIIGTASTGVLQGDPLSTLYFAIGIQPLLSRLKNKLRDIEDTNGISPYSKRGIIFAIADDITIHARTPDLFELSSMLGTLFEHHQLPLNIEKSWIIGSRVFSQTGRSTLPCRRLNEGGKILGVPVGDLASCLSWMEAHFSEHAPPARTLEHLQARTAVTLLKYSYNSRMQYLRKILPEHFVDTGIFSKYDEKIDEALLNTGIADDREELRLLRCLPLDKGGLGMPLLHGHHGQRHHLISSMRTKEFLKLYYPYLIHDHTILFNTRDIDLDATPPDDLLDFIQQLRARAPEEAPLTIFIKACRKQSEEIDSSSASVFHQQLVAANRLDDAAKFLSLQGVKLMFAFHPSCFRSSFETQLSNKEYVAAMRSQLLAPIRRGIEGESFCRCRPEHAVDLSIFPHHASNCALNGRERTFRHSEVCKLLTKLLRKASSSARVTLEPRDASARHPDIAVVEDSGHYHIDVAIVEPTSRRATSSAESSATTKGAAAAYMERTKITTYANTAWPATVPFVLESTGFMGNCAMTLLERITKDSPPLLTWFKGELALLLARSEGRMRLHSQSLLH